MKKLLGIVVLGLLSFKEAYAEKFTLKCITDYRVTKGGKEPLQKLFINHVFDLKQNMQREKDSELSITYFIPTDEAFLEYSMGPLLGGGFFIQTIIWDRLDGKRIIRTVNLSIEKYKKIKKELDKINSKIKNYKKDLSWGTKHIEFQI